MITLNIRAKLLIIFTLIFTLAFAVFGVVAYLRFSAFALELAEDKLQSDANSITDSTADVVYGEDALALHDAWLDHTLTPDLELVQFYNQLFQQTQAFYPELDLQFTVTYVEEQNQEVITLLNFEDNSEVASVRTITDDKEWATQLDAREVSYQYKVEETTDGLTMSSSAPLRDPAGASTGAILNVFLKADNQLARVQRDIRNTILVSALIIYPLLLGAILLVAYAATRVLNQFTSAAAALEQGQPYSPERLAKAKLRGDELGQLARVFDKMAQEVQAREEKLKQELIKLKIEIDYTKQNKEVDEITESDYFRDLKAKKEVLKHARPQSTASATATEAVQPDAEATVLMIEAIKPVLPEEAPEDDFMASLKQKAAGMKKKTPHAEIATDPYMALLRDQASSPKADGED